MKPSSKSPPTMPRINISERIAAGIDPTVEQLVEDLERYYLINDYRFVRAAIETYVTARLKTRDADWDRLFEAQRRGHEEHERELVIRRAKDVDVRSYATRLEAALAKAHTCPTVREDGECDGCYISEALASWPVVAPDVHMSGSAEKLTTGTQNPICGSNHCRNTDPNHGHRMCPACIASRDNGDDSGKCTCP